MAIDAGTFTDLACINAWYGGEVRGVLRSMNVLVVRFSGRFHKRHIVEAYAAHPRVLSAGADIAFGSGDDMELCNQELGGTHRYIVSRGWGDCPAGCIDWAYRSYDVSEDGEARLVGAWGQPIGSMGVPRTHRLPPAWMTCAGTPSPEPEADEAELPG